MCLSNGIFQYSPDNGVINCLQNMLMKCKKMRENIIDLGIGRGPLPQDLNHITYQKINTQAITRPIHQRKLQAIALQKILGLHCCQQVLVYPSITYVHNC